MTFLLIVLWCSIGMGMAASLVALYGRYKVLPEIITGPLSCEIESSGCNTLFQKKEGALLGLPNAFLGVVLYVSLTIGLLISVPTWLLFFAASSGLVMSIYLGCNLMKHKRQCNICWAGHLSNTLIWLSLLVKLLILKGSSS